jgi:glucokinase
MGQNNRYIGVDLGATKTLAVLFDESLSPLGQARVKTPSEKDADAVLDAILALINEVCALCDCAVADLACVGVAVPAPIDRASGIVIQAPNMGLKDYPMAKRMNKALGVPVYLENDVRAGAWAEYRKGALRGFRNSIAVFIGTGIGGGIIIDGKLLDGSHGHAGEVGHMILQEGGASCGCGQYGCLEALASRTAMAKDAAAAIASGKSPALLEKAGSDFRKLKSSAFEHALSLKDPITQRIVERSAFWAGVGLANLVNVLDPEAIVLGGGIVSRFGDLYRAKAEESMRAHIMPGFVKGVKVLASELGDLAVPSGAAITAKESLESAGTR